MAHATDERVETVVIGGGQAGLAMSRCLTDLTMDHVVLERGQVAERWRSERWDSLRLLTPNWYTRLPGHRYEGPDPDGFMSRPEVIEMFERYAGSFGAPVRSGIEVTAVDEVGRHLRVSYRGGSLLADNVVVATGHAAHPRIPAVAADLPAGVTQLPSSSYRSPAALPPGGVLVVGAGPSGQQIAVELAAAGRDVVLAVGNHRRLPRRHRGRDVIWWSDRMGHFAQTLDVTCDPSGALRSPSLTLWGAQGGRDLDLGVVARAGVTLAGHLEAVVDGRARFAADLAVTVADAERRCTRFLDAVDAFAARQGLSHDAVPGRPEPAWWGDDGVTEVDLASRGISTVVWATGYRRDFGWIHPPVLDATGEPVQRRGITSVPGLCFLGLRWMHTRSSSFIGGVGRDAEYVAEQLESRRASAWRVA